MTFLAVSSYMLHYAQMFDFTQKSELPLTHVPCFHHIPSVRIARGLWVEPPTSSCRPPTSGQNSTPGGRVSTPHLSFAEIGMLFEPHLLLMQFLKYLGLHHDDLNVTKLS